MEFLVFGEDWGRHPSSSQHIMSLVAKQYPVTWINSIGLRQPRLKAKDIRRMIEKVTMFFWTKSSQSTTLPSPNSLHVVKPLVWPLASHKWVKYLNRHLLAQQLPKKKSFRVVWIALPSAIEYLSLLDADVIIYYCGDDFSALAGVDHQKATQAENALVPYAHQIYVANPTLASRFPPQKTVYLPHGVDVGLFQRSYDCPAMINPKQKNIGFYGSLNEWLDYDLLKKLAIARPNIQFYFIGNIECEKAAQLQNRNIHFLPAQPHHALAAYLQHWDAAILPFTNNQQIQACNPLKLREYLAAGCPVISSYYPAAADYKDLVSLSHCMEDWLQAIDEYTQWSPQQRLDYQHRAYLCVQHETWQHRKNQILSFIHQQQPLFKP